MPAPAAHTKAKDDPLYRLGLVQATVSCETVGGNYLRFQVLRGTMQYRAVCIFGSGNEEWEIYPYRNGRLLRNPMKDGPTATIVRLNVRYSRAWHQHAAKFNT